jgi:signal transduction histidine kinase
VRLSELPRTTSFRLALLFLLLFGAASLALFGFMYCQTRGYLAMRVDNWLGREQSIYHALDPDARLEHLAAHVTGDPALERPFTLYDPAGKRIAGSPLSLPPDLLATMPQDQPFDFMIHHDGETVRYRGLVHRMPTTGNLLLIAEDMSSTTEFGEVLVTSFLWGGLVTALLGLAGAAMTGASAVRRIDAVTLAIQRIVNGDLSGRLPTQGSTGDLDRLILEINFMLSEIERLMYEVKGVCDNVAHDLRTPLTRLLAGLQRARRRASTAQEYAAAVDEAILETRGLLKTFAAMLRIAEVESGARRAGFAMVDLPRVAADAVELYEPMAEEKGVSLRLEADGAPAMRGDPNLLFEAIGNLMDNALKFTPRGGRITIRTFATPSSVGFQVADDGPGIPRNEREAVLRRFHRAEESRHTPGSGLGLALVAAVARLHGMELVITDAAPGCRITVARRDALDGSGTALAQETEPDGAPVLAALPAD